MIETLFEIFILVFMVVAASMLLHGFVEAIRERRDD